MNSMKTHSLFFLLFWMISHSMVAQKRQVVDGYPIANFALTVNASVSGDFFGQIMQNPGTLGDWLTNRGAVMFSIEKDGRRQLFSEFPKKNIIREFPFVKNDYKGSSLTKVTFTTEAFCPLGVNDAETSALPVLMLEICCSNPTSKEEHFTLVAQPDENLAKDMSFSENDEYTGISNKNNCQITTDQTESLWAGQKLSIPVSLLAGEKKKIKVLFTFRDDNWISSINFRALDDLSAYAYKMWSAFKDKTTAFSLAIPKTGDKELDTYVRWYMIPGVSLTKWTKKGELVTMGYRELNQRDSYWTSWLHLVFYKDLERKMIEESIEWQQPSGKIPTTILPLIEREDDLDINAFFILRIARFYRYYHNKQDLINYWPAMKNAMNWLISRDTDKIGLPAQVSFWGDWKDVKGIEGRKYSPFTCLIYLSALKEMVYLAEECGDQAGANYYQSAYQKGYKTMNKDVREGGLWNGNYYCQIWKDGSVNDRILQDQTIGILFDVVPRERALKIIETLNTKSMTPYGIAETFPYYDDSFGYPSATYHNGGVWPWVSFMDCWARINMGQQEEAIDIIKKVGRADLVNSGDWSPNEHINSLTGENLGYHIQGWNTGLFGLVYFGLVNTEIMY